MYEQGHDNTHGDHSERLKCLKISTNGDHLERLRCLKISSGDGGDDPPLSPGGSVSEEDDEDLLPVTLGFVEKPKHSWSLLPQLFPSKAGGTPAWLDPTQLPVGRSCVCDFCGEPLRFLLQVYAPFPEKKSTFHRTLFIFMCPSMACLLKDQHEQWKRHPDKASRSVKVFRCQLPRINPFYSSEPPRNDGTDKPSRASAALCRWCGTWRGDKICSNCRRVRYCSVKHQASHWRFSHKTECQQSSITSVASPSSSDGMSTDVQKVASNTLWQEFEIVNEDECDSKQSVDNGFANTLVSQSQTDEAIESLMENFEGDDDKRTWASFQERISWAPEQVLRYYGCGRAKALWPMSSGQPSRNDIPQCSCCGGPRSCEFQVLPQLLYYFGVENDVDSLDWATIVVYTCEASCVGSIAYKEEFCWVQLASQSATTLN